MSSSNEHPLAGPATDDDPTPSRMRVKWKAGPRTRAWDELWRWLLSPEEVHPPGSAGTPASSDRERQRDR